MENSARRPRGWRAECCWHCSVRDRKPRPQSGSPKAPKRRALSPAPCEFLLALASLAVSRIRLLLLHSDAKPGAHTCPLFEAPGRRKAARPERLWPWPPYPRPPRVRFQTESASRGPFGDISGLPLLRDV